MKILHYLKTHKLLLGLCLLFFFVRLIALDNTFLLHDERDISFSGYMIAKTGADLNGHMFPLFFKNIEPHNPLFAIYYAALWWIFIPWKTAFFARLPFVLISSLLIFLVYEIVLRITKRKDVSLLTTLLYCFSPWVFHITRTALDIPLAMVTLGGGILLYLKEKRYLAYILFLISIFTYQGFRLLLPFLIIYLELFFYLENKDKKQFFIQNLKNGLFIILTAILIFVVDFSTIQGRASQVAFTNLQFFGDQVTFNRNTSQAPEMIRKIFDNKLTASMNYVVTNFVKGQDLTYLFKDGDNSAINGNISAGQFLLPFLIFYYLGFVSLGKKGDKFSLYIIGFTLISLIPALLSLNGTTFSIRAMPSGIGFAYLISMGILYGFSLVEKDSRLIKKSFYGIFLVFFLLSFSYFTYNYFFRRPILIAETFNANEKHLSQFLENNKDKKLTIYTSSPKNVLLSYLYLEKQTDVAQISHIYKGTMETVTWDNFTFTMCANKKNYLLDKNIVVSERCLPHATYEALTSNPPPKFIPPFKSIPYSDFSQNIAYFIFEE